jgi:tetratricopeptide (TPR) repeat protein
MKRTTALLLFLAAFALCAGSSFADIQEVADDDGNITHYKYTDRNGSVVFTDSLAKIPEEYRKKNKVVRVGAPARKAAPVGSQPEAAPAPPPAEAPPAAAQFQVKPEAPPAPAASSGGLLWLIGALALGAGGAGFWLYKRQSAGTPPRRPDNGHAGRERGPLPPPDPAREHRRPRDPQEQRGEPDRSQPREKPEETLKRLVLARDYAAAAKLCETLGDLGAAAGYHLESGNPVRAREIYLQLKEHRRAAELFEKAGDLLKAAELFEAAAQKEGPDARGAGGNESATRSGQLYLAAGAPERAAAVYLKAGLFAEAAAIFEAAQEYLKAAAAYLKAGSAEKAAACFEKGGDPVKGYATLSRFCYDQGNIKEAAAYAEKAGDLMNAATMFQEVGEFARAGDLFFRSGFFAEAAENFSLANDLARAAAAHEQAGNYLQAAQAYETVGTDKEKLATLYEKGGDCYLAGRLFVKLGQLDRALNVLQQVDPAAPNYPNASLLVGMIFLKRGLADLAREKFLKLIDNHPVGKGNLEPYYFLALCHEHAGEPERAKSIFSKILAEDYNYRDVRKRLGQP